MGKKDGRLRMVVDCRLSNLYFETPEKVHLCTAESLTRIELPLGAALIVSTADLKDAFYHFELPVPLRKYFGMRSIRAGELGLTQVGGKPVSVLTPVFPRLKVLPMG